VGPRPWFKRLAKLTAPDLWECTCAKSGFDPSSIAIGRFPFYDPSPAADLPFSWP
jgi:hypothetical protein